MYRGTRACHDANVRPYAAYLRVYEPLSAFGDAERRYWAEYAASVQRPRRAAALDAEQAEALSRLIATPPIAAPQRESGHAYVRWADGVTYICPWQTRLRSWLELARLRSAARPLLATAFAAGQADQALRDFASWQGQASSLRVFIQSCTWAVPPGWFVPFAPEERWLVLGGAAEADGQGPATAAATRTLIYATAMSQARRRIARALNVLRRTSGDALTSPPGAAGGRDGLGSGARDGLGSGGRDGLGSGGRDGRGTGARDGSAPSRRNSPGGRNGPGPGGRNGTGARDGSGPVGRNGPGPDGRNGPGPGGRSGPARGERSGPGPWQATVDIAQIGRWLEEFHPHSVVELDYGGLVHLLDDDSLRADQSVAEVSAAISASREGQQDLAGVLYQRLRSRWQALESLEAAN